MFWENFVRLCNEAGKSPSRVAIELNLSKTAVTHWRKGVSPHDATLHLLADYFGVSVEELTQEEAGALVNSTFDSSTFWQNFMRLCNKAGKPPSRVAVDVGLSSTSAVGWKKGAVPRPAVLSRLADYFSVPVESLTAEMPPVLDEKNPPAPKSESERENVPTDTVMAQIIETASRLQPIQREFLLAFLKTVVQNTPAEAPQGQRSWTVSPAAVAAGNTATNANIHP